MQYYFVQSGITRSRQCATLAEADVEAREALQRHNWVVYIKQGTKGSRETTLIETVYANCVAWR